ncbi:Clr5 domain-containing protein [Aspergillus avenaceus]|uniref:Clr5 domain-containing protein n=1 Tax=Aspergillus avenaceus TaxID=36643 RepID=A0A5N6TQ85_ASPAV|nr:Clr5 domain-containing protein [Aspergillus avenaceus]
MMDGSIPPSSAISPPSSSAIFRPRRSDDWHEYRPIIEQLYRDNQLKLRDVKKIMERDYRFHASEKQYKDRLAAWHVRKNIKAKEVHVMIRKQQKRAARGKQTAFRVAGQEVDSKRIARFVRRYGTSWDGNPRTEPPPQPQPPTRTSPEPTTPSDMSCYTPEPDARDRSSTLSPRPETHSPHSEINPSFSWACTTLEPTGALQGVAYVRETWVNQITGSNKLKIEHALASEIDDSHSLTTTLSPSLPNDTPKSNEEDDDVWGALDTFQNKLLALQHTLEHSMDRFKYTHEDDTRNAMI